MIKVDKKLNVKYSGIKKDVMSEFTKIVASLRRDCSEEDLKICFNLGLEVYEKFKNPKVQTFEINAKTKEQAVRQVKALELPKHVEKVVLEQLMKE